MKGEAPQSSVSPIDSWSLAQNTVLIFMSFLLWLVSNVKKQNILALLGAGLYIEESLSMLL